MTPTEKNKLVDDLKSAMRGDPELGERVVVAALNMANGRTNDERELALKLFRVLANVVWHTEPPSAGRYGDFAFGEVLDLLDLEYAGTPMMVELRKKLFVSQATHDAHRRKGDWLAAARGWMQRNVNLGDSLQGNSAHLVTLPFHALEDLAKEVAEACERPKGQADVRQ